MMANTSDNSSINRQALLGAGFALLSAVGFSGKAILVKLAYRDGVDAVTLLALRMLFSVPIFMAVAVWSRGQNHANPIGKRDWAAIIGLGVLGYYMSSLLDFSGLAYISAGLERLVLFLYPTMVVVLSAMLFKQPIRRQEVIALALSYAGIALVFVHDLGTSHAGIALGALLVFGSTLTYSMYLIGAGRVIARVGAIRFTAYAMLVASVATLIQFALTHPIATIHQPVRVYELSLAMAVFSTVLPVFMLSAGIRLIGSGHTSLIGSIGPVSTIFMAQYFLGEPMSMLQMIGSSLVLAGVLSVSARRQTKRVPSDTAPAPPAPIGSAYGRGQFGSSSRAERAFSPAMSAERDRSVDGA
jgi:drug/metabolite transporter (DMT)-like permease